MDNKLVHVLTTAFDPEDHGEVRRMQRSGTAATVQCPLAVSEYTKKMGGVDRFHHKRGSYSVSRRSRRWWLWNFFCLDAAIVDAYILCASVHPELTINMLEFCTTLFRALLSNYSSRRRRSFLEGGSYIRRTNSHKSTSQKTGRNQHPVSWSALATADVSVPSLSVSNNVQLMWCCTVHITVLCSVLQIKLAKFVLFQIFSCIVIGQ